VKLKQQTSVIRMPAVASFACDPPGSAGICRRQNCDDAEQSMLNLEAKIIPYDQLSAWRDKNRGERKLVVTNGCFDLLHLGHVTYLQNARNLGDALLVGVNGDAAVRGLKGAGRPVNSEYDRAAVIAALESVSYVCIFPDIRATEFLSRARPDIYVKGGDYTLETLDQNERRTVEKSGGRIHLIPFVPGKSTTAVLRKMAAPGG
jgi:rfaE bifunctional protein nucleotidyltransferase chain/domain